jgi:hypothetical protein
MRRVLLLVVLIAVGLSVHWTADARTAETSFCSMPSGFRYIPGNSSDPNAYAPGVINTIPAGFLRFLGGGEGDPFDLAPRTSVTDSAYYLAPVSAMSMPTSDDRAIAALESDQAAGNLGCFAS